MKNLNMKIKNVKHFLINLNFLFLFLLFIFLIFLQNLNSATYIINPSSVSVDYVSQSRLFVGTSQPSNPQHGDLFYNISNNALQKFDERTRARIPIEWQSIVRASPEWQAGRLRINPSTGRLEISPNGSNWYWCIPAVGSLVIELMNIDNTNYSLLYWIAPGQTVIIKRRANHIPNHIPIVYARDVVPFFSGSYFHSYSFEQWIGLRPSNIAISNGDGQFFGAAGSSPSAGRSTSLSIVPIMEQSAIEQNWANFEIRILSDNRFLVNAMGQGHGGYYVLIANSSGKASDNSYWLSIWFTQNGQQFTMDYLTLTRRA